MFLFDFVSGHRYRKSGCNVPHQSLIWEKVSVLMNLEAFVLTEGRGYTEGSSELVIWSGWGLLFYSHDCLTVRAAS